MEADMITFKESSDKMEATNLEATPEVTQPAMERQELRERLVVRRRR
jgi:hypothetical protein